MICEGCGKETDAEFSPYCYDCYVECMENYDEARGKALAEFIEKISHCPGVEVHFPTDEGMMKISKGEITPSPYGKGC